jgi:quercetin dioxygenase-like cupin family protein
MQWFNIIIGGGIRMAGVAVMMSGAAEAKADPHRMVVRGFDSLVFSEAISGEPKLAPVLGVPEKQASSIVMKMGKGAFPMHSHTANYELVVIKGTMKHWGVDSSREQALPLDPGSYWYQPAGQPHADSCESDACVWFIRLDGARDFALHP